MRASDLRVLLQSYYGIRLALVSTYFLSRHLFPESKAQKPSSFLPGATQEFDIAAFAVILLVRGSRNAASVAEFADTVVFYFQLLAAACFYLSDFTAFCRFSVALIAVALAVPKPVVDCGSCVQYLTPLDVFRLLPKVPVVPSRRVVDDTKEPVTKAAGKKGASSAATADKPVTNGADPNRPRMIVVVGRGGTDNVLATVAEIARDRRAAASNEQPGHPDPVRFGYVDAQRYGAVASSDLGVDIGVLSLSLPSVLEIAGGEITRRLPPIAEDGSVTSVKLEASGLVRFFHLDSA
jgi:hypothetical protein